MGGIPTAIARHSVSSGVSVQRYVAGEAMKAFQQNAFQDNAFQIRNVGTMAFTLDGIAFSSAATVYSNTISITLDGINVSVSTWFTQAVQPATWTDQPDNSSVWTVQ